MRTIDLTPELARKKGATIQRTTLYVKLPYIAFYHPHLGIGFVRFIKKKNNIALEKSGRVKWFHSIKGDLKKAITYARRLYKIKIPVKGWEKIKVRHYNLSGAEEVVKALLKLK